MASYVETGLWLPQANILARQTDNVTSVVHDTCSRTAGTNIDTDVVIELWTELIVRVDGHLSGLLPRRVAVWKTGGLRHDGCFCCCLLVRWW